MYNLYSCISNTAVVYREQKREETEEIGKINIDDRITLKKAGQKHEATINSNCDSDAKIIQTNHAEEFESECILLSPGKMVSLLNSNDLLTDILYF